MTLRHRLEVDGRRRRLSASPHVVRGPTQAQLPVAVDLAAEGDVRPGCGRLARAHADERRRDARLPRSSSKPPVAEAVRSVGALLRPAVARELHRGRQLGGVAPRSTTTSALGRLRVRRHVGGARPPGRRRRRGRWSQPARAAPLPHQRQGRPRVARERPHRRPRDHPPDDPLAAAERETTTRSAGRGTPTSSASAATGARSRTATPCASSPWPVPSATT
jgi:hypothetical protein